MNCREGDETFTERKPRRDFIPCHVVVNDGDCTQLTRIYVPYPHTIDGHDCLPGDVIFLMYDIYWDCYVFFFQISRPKNGFHADALTSS
jgi:hypothetical protein